MQSDGIATERRMVGLNNRNLEGRRMASKRRPTKKAVSRAPGVPSETGEDHAATFAHFWLLPTIQAAVAIAAYNNASESLDLGELVNALAEQTRETVAGNMNRSEVMLTAQAHTLDAIFNNHARHAINAQHMNNLDRYLKLALRAQSQCRATWEALATIKNPPVMGYVRQANIAHGPQQVNNASAAPDSGSRAGEKQDRPNKLLEEKDGERLDTGAAGKAGEVDSEMAPLGKVERTKNRRG